MEQAARAVGLSERQLRRRIEATKPLLAPYLGPGEKNRVLLDPGAVETLRAVERRRASGQTLAGAREWVAVSMRGEQGSGDGRTGGEVSGEVAVLRELVDGLRHDRDQFALPALRTRRASFGGLFRRRGD